jgi:D-3-phosphoglycerate dehydrogenase
MKPLIVATSSLLEEAIKELEKEARIVITKEETEAATVKAARKAQGILFKGRVLCTRSLMAACGQLKVVARYGVGLDGMDLAAATEFGIPVVYAPASNSNSVAEHTIMLMLALAKQALVVDRQTRLGDWGKNRWQGKLEMRGKTLGIIGVGNCGRRVAKTAAAIGMRIIGYDKYVSAEELRNRGVEPMGDMVSVLRQADVVTFHTPLTPETRHMINAETIAQMKVGVILINTSRGKVQDQQALVEALEGGKIRAAGIDVFEEEPVPVDSRLFKLDNVIVSPHIAGVTQDCMLATAMQVTAEMLRVLRGEKPHDLGNPDLWPKLAHLK